MDKRKGIILTAVTLVFSIFLCVFLYNVDNKYTQQAPQPINGILFISDKNLTQNPIYFLIREWEFFPDALLTPEELNDYDGYRHYTDIGGRHGMITHGSSTYHLTLILPEHEDTYTLELPEIFSSCRLFIDGAQVLQLGEPSPEHYKDGIANRIVSFTASGRTDLLLMVSDFSGIYSGMTYPPTFGTTHAVLQMREIRLLIHGGTVLLALLGMAMAMAFSLRGNLHRGILCWLICLCLIGIVGYPLLHSLFITGFQPWYSIEICCTYCLLMLAVLLQCELYGLHGKRVLLLVTPCAIGLLCAILRVSVGTFLNHSIGITFSYISVCLKYYAAACLTCLSCWALWEGKRYSAPLMAASVSMSVCLVFDRLFPLYEPIYGGWFGEIGGILLTASLGTALWLDALDAYRFQLTYADGYRQMERQLSMQKDHYHQLSEQIQRSREAAHDIRHHMRTLRGIVNEGNLNRLTAYLDSYEPHLIEREVTVWSDHPAADAVLGYYSTAAKKLEAIYDVRLAIPPELTFPDDELCIILGNLLENAIEAMVRQHNGQRRLYLRGNLIDGRLGLVLDNTFDGTLQEHAGKYISTKHGGFGIGVSSVRAIAEKYGGLADFSAEDHIFHASVMIPINENTFSH